MSGVRGVVMLVAVWGLGCGGSSANSSGESSAPVQGPVATMEGRVRVTGSEPLVTTIVEGSAGRMTLAGELLAELKRLSGADVRVEGQVGGVGPAARMNVTEYWVLSVGGERPVVGVLSDADGVVWLVDERDDAAPVRLVAPPAALMREVGAKVWVVGDRTDDGIRPTSFGVIRPSR